MAAPIIVALTEDFLKAAAVHILEPKPGEVFDLAGAALDLRNALVSAAMSTGQSVAVEDELPL